MKIFDSVKKEKVEFIPINKNEVKIYVCGPTVYDDAHLGHARSSISFDVLRRVLTKLKYRVTFVKNFTDIDDKIIKKANELNIDFEEVAKKYTESYLSDMSALNVQRADIEPKATEYLDDMFDFIQILLDKEVAYKISSGDIYFNSSKDEKYLSLSHKNQDENETINRVEKDSEVKHSKDFVLWKAKKDGDNIFFDSPFGAGRPGWHLECSSMIDKLLSDETKEFAIDIHAGGADLLFPHHENEASQSRCAKNQELSKYWMHNGFVNIDGEKMSKSLGNSFFIKDALEHYSGEVLRFYLMQSHYRANFNFNEEDLLSSKKRLDKLYRLKKRIYGFSKKQSDKEFEKELLNALSDDLNISIALAKIDEMVSKYNEELDNNPKDKILKQKLNSNIDFLDEVLGIGSLDSFEYFQFGIDKESKTKIENLIEQRSNAKKEKNFELADKLRDEITKLGIAIMDTPNGTLWEKI